MDCHQPEFPSLTLALTLTLTRGLHKLTAALLFVLNSSQIYHMSSITLLSGCTMKSHPEKGVLGCKDQGGLGHSHSI